jgi:CRP-like cAMP-binding protein
MVEKKDVLESAALFAGIKPELILRLLRCIGAREVKVPKGGRIIEEGEPVAQFSILLSGSGRSVKTDAEGRVILITLLSPGSEIGVLLCANPDHRSPVTVQADEDSSVLMVRFSGLMARCAENCPQHERLIQNYAGVLARKGLTLHERIDCLLRPTVREKIMAYLNRASREQGGFSIKLPPDRSAMAEYLNVNRSALSRELSSMKHDGLIDYYKSNFELKYGNHNGWNGA